MNNSRRNFIKLGIICASTPLVALANDIFVEQERVLSFLNIHTREYLEVAYWQNSSYNQEALNKINYILRDWKKNNPPH